MTSFDTVKDGVAKTIGSLALQIKRTSCLTIFGNRPVQAQEVGGKAE
jgi:hypothetical protein